MARMPSSPGRYGTGAVGRARVHLGVRGDADREPADGGDVVDELDAYR
jgi:hypothetical protein